MIPALLHVPLRPISFARSARCCFQDGHTALDVMIEDDDVIEEFVSYWELLKMEVAGLLLRALVLRGSPIPRSTFPINSVLFPYHADSSLKLIQVCVSAAELKLRRQ